MCHRLARLVDLHSPSLLFGGAAAPHARARRWRLGCRRRRRRPRRASPRRHRRHRSAQRVHDARHDRPAQRDRERLADGALAAHVGLCVRFEGGRRCEVAARRRCGLGRARRRARACTAVGATPTTVTATAMPTASLRRLSSLSNHGSTLARTCVHTYGCVLASAVDVWFGRGCGAPAGRLCSRSPARAPAVRGAVAVRP